MGYMTIFAISAPVVQVPNEKFAAEGKVVFEAQYVAMAMVPNFEDAILQAVPLVRERFSEGEILGEATINVITEKDEISALYFGHSTYAPRGLREIPLVIVQEADFGSIDYITKHFAVPATSVKPETD